MYTLQVCSLLVIPPPIGRTVPQGGFPTDLTKLNLLGWADLVQDVAVGLQALPPRLCLDLGTQVVALLQLLEAATGVGFCHYCCHPRPRCMCTGASQPAPLMLWSQIVQQAQGYGVTSTSRGVTDPSTPMGGMPGYMAPSPGLTPPDFSIWSIPPPEVPPPPGLPASPLYQCLVGRAAPGWNEPMMILKGVGPRNIHGCNQGGEKTGQPFPSHSRVRREDAPPPRRSTGIQDSSCWPVTM